MLNETLPACPGQLWIWSSAPDRYMYYTVIATVGCPAEAEYANLPMKDNWIYCLVIENEEISLKWISPPRYTKGSLGDRLIYDPN